MNPNLQLKTQNTNILNSFGVSLFEMILMIADILYMIN